MKSPQKQLMTRTFPVVGTGVDPVTSRFSGVVLKFVFLSQRFGQ
jgi:hypothetical protein